MDTNEGVEARQDWPAVTIAILAYNRRDAVRTTLRTVLEALDYPPDRRQVIVVDNASGDGTQEMVQAEFGAVEVIRLEENVGVSGWNAALPAATGSWLLLLDDDCYIEGDALKRSIAAAEADRADLVSYAVRSSVQPDYRFNDEYATGLLSFWGCAALVRREAFERLGGYDPFIFIWANELDFTIRLLDRGYRHLFLPEVVATHMKAPNPPGKAFVERPHGMTYRHFAYIAAKSLRPVDAARVLGRLSLTLALESWALSPRVLTHTVPLAAAGARAGLRSRRPVRPVVSATYRDGLGSFANPLRFVRPLRARVPGARDKAAYDGWARFRSARPELYPEDSGLLEL